MALVIYDGGGRLALFAIEGVRECSWAGLGILRIERANDKEERVYGLSRVGIKPKIKRKIE